MFRRRVTHSRCPAQRRAGHPVPARAFSQTDSFPPRRPPPDAPLTDGTRVFDLLRGPHATLLAVDWQAKLPALPASVHIHRVASPAARSAYDAHTPILFLIRPDNYVGCATHSPGDITDYPKLIAQ
ncbi:hypothetical protein Asi03nite_32580 [Actinoplanes siamensis]|uniref:Uncharacterized protein n=1 Tax=Actinoplanes siamensis TaxID=1223317 RepID=A0A919N7G1_9ACTN|nr:hypothetical protein Asi03nite_32580 [Actinoplanes siamensis]